MTTKIFNILESTDETHLIGGGEFTSAQANEIKTALLSFDTEKKPLVLSLKDVTAIDLAGLQLVYAWQKEQINKAVTVQVILPESEAIKDLLLKTGITKLF